jgi:DNA processing protein
MTSYTDEQIEAVGKSLTSYTKDGYVITEGDINHQVETMARLGVGIIPKGDDLYPAGLNDLGTKAPEALFYRGDADVVRGLQQAVVMTGARASTGYGEHITMEFANRLHEKGRTVVNGGGYGIDGMAIRAQLASDGKPIVWLAGGVDRLYPAGHDTLLNRVIEEGALVSAMPMGFAPTKWRMVMRSEYLAHTTAAVVIVEAGWRSGSLRVAEAGFEVGVGVFAVPGPVTSASSAGCHRLIAEGKAKLITSADDIWYRLAG